MIIEPSKLEVKRQLKEQKKDGFTFNPRGRITSKRNAIIAGTLFAGAAGCVDLVDVDVPAQSGVSDCFFYGDPEYRSGIDGLKGLEDDYIQFKCHIGDRDTGGTRASAAKVMGREAGKLEEFFPLMEDGGFMKYHWSNSTIDKVYDIVSKAQVDANSDEYRRPTPATGILATGAVLAAAAYVLKQNSKRKKE